ncbi:MAG TPA: hypothetical protein ACFYEK_15755 [Candidatus Wunengus sp. YC60]|uniref:hypothetical protein n=1 Tax=Candidatus Wunengus sp. YC60 TaxID=3367697 RepID=UPI00402586BE
MPDGAPQEIGFSRRDFLKLTLSTLAFTSACSIIDPKLRGSDSSQYGPDIDFTGLPMYRYDNDTQKIIENTENTLGIKILSPRFWLKGADNLPWLSRDINYLTEYLLQLPANYLFSDRSPKQIALIKTLGTSSQGVGGGYTSRGLMLFLAEDFSAEATMPGEAGKIYGLQKMHLKYRIGHEYTHSYIEAQNSLLPDFEKQTGWNLVNGVWVNKLPQNLIHEDNADHNPNEDIATSFGRLFINPSTSYVSNDRHQFFASNPLYHDWALSVKLLAAK